jgi:hypothetical protein
VTAYLVDTNVLLRVVKPDDRDYSLVRSAMYQLWTTGYDRPLLHLTGVSGTDGECRGRTERFHALPDALRRVPATYKAL